MKRYEEEIYVEKGVAVGFQAGGDTGEEVVGSRRGEATYACLGRSQWIANWQFGTSIG